jgi:hypothetical protein
MNKSGNLLRLFATRLSTLVAIMVLAAAISCRAEDAALSKAKIFYRVAAERALAPLKAAYERELRKLLDQYTKSGNLTAVVEVQGELDALAANPNAAADIGKKLAKTSWTYGTSSTMTFGVGQTVRVNTDTPQKWFHSKGLTIKWDDGTLVTFGEDFATYEVITPAGIHRTGKRLADAK